MADTTAEIKRDIEKTRERMSDTLSQLEQKLNVAQVVRDNPWPALAIAASAGFLLAGNRRKVTGAVATVAASSSATRRVGSLFDEAATRLLHGVSAAIGERVDSWVDEVKGAIGGSHHREMSVHAEPLNGAATPGSWRGGTRSESDRKMTDGRRSGGWQEFR